MLVWTVQVRLGLRYREIEVVRLISVYLYA